jgi:hypothetical protein
LKHAWTTFCKCDCAFDCVVVSDLDATGSTDEIHSFVAAAVAVADNFVFPCAAAIKLYVFAQF